MHQRLQHADHAGKLFFFDLRYQALQPSSPSLRSLASVLKLKEFMGFHLKSCDEMEDEVQSRVLPAGLNPAQILGICSSSLCQLLPRHILCFPRM